MSSSPTLKSRIRLLFLLAEFGVDVSRERCDLGLRQSTLERWHVILAVGDLFLDLCVGHLLNHVGMQIWDFETLAGRRTCAVRAMAHDAIRFVRLGGNVVRSDSP